MPLAVAELKLRDLHERGKGFRKGLVTPYVTKDAFVVVAEHELPKYRFAWLSFSYHSSSLNDIASALKGRGWTRVPYIYFDFFCMPRDDDYENFDGSYKDKHFKFIFRELVKLNSEVHVFGTASLRRGMVLNDLARAKRPIIYTADDFPEGASLQQELQGRCTAENYPGFEGSQFRDEADRPAARQKIEEVHGSIVTFDRKVRNLLMWQSQDGPRMRLLRVDALLNCSALTTVSAMQVTPKMDHVVSSIVSEGNVRGSYTSHDLLATYWYGEAGTTERLFREGAFVDLSWSDFRKASYAVITYGWATITWSDIIAALKAAPMTTPVEFIWIDIFCLDQHNPNKMDVVRRTPAIYGGAKEYHVFGKVVASRGWCTCELASAHHPILHTSSDLPSDGLAHKVEMHPSTPTEFQGFEKADFFVESDRDSVRDMIETQNFSVTNFDAEMRHFFDVNLPRLERWCGHRRRTRELQKQLEELRDVQQAEPEDPDAPAPTPALDRHKRRTREVEKQLEELRGVQQAEPED